MGLLRVNLPYRINSPLILQIVSLSEFYVAGISYRKSDAAVRGQFSVGADQLEKIYASARNSGVRECFVLSTCNRTEIFGFSPAPDIFPQLLCACTDGTADVFRKNGYIKKGMDAMRHLFNVTAGMDSQILGDYEIVGQVRRAVETAKKFDSIGINLGRLVNEAVRATKKVRTNTAFSSGTVSVSFAAVQYLKDHFENPSQKKIVLIGTGKIGNNTCKNLVDYFPAAEITVMNRTAEKAESLAAQFGLNWASMDDLQDVISTADAVLVATSSETPLIMAGHLEAASSKIIIDFSIPCNVSPDVSSIPGITLVGVDELSRIKDETLLKRSSEIPRVEAIINEHIEEFTDWHTHRRHVPLLHAVKNKLYAMHGDEQDADTRQRIQKVVNGVAVKMRTHNLPGCHYLEAINDFMRPAFQES